MDDNRQGIAAPGWFRLAAIGAVLWEVAGCALYLMRVTTDAASLPADQQARIFSRNARRLFTLT